MSSEVLEDGFKLSNLTPGISVPEGIAFDPYTETFWLLGLMDEKIYHVGKKNNR